MKRFITSALGGAAVAGAVALAPMAAAEANAPTYSSCAGTVVGQQPIKNGSGTVISRVQVWKSGSGRDTVLCIRNVHVGSYVGKRVFTSIVLSMPNGQNIYDRGDYTHYAGALRFRKNWSIKVGGSEPSGGVPTTVCNRVHGKTGTHKSGPIWLCYRLDV